MMQRVLLELLPVPTLSPAFTVFSTTVPVMGEVTL